MFNYPLYSEECIHVFSIYTMHLTLCTLLSCVAKSLTSQMSATDMSMTPSTVVFDVYLA